MTNACTKRRVVMKYALCMRLSSHTAMKYALCFFGSLPRFQRRDSGTCKSLGKDVQVLHQLVLPLLRDRVLRPSAASATFDEVAVYGHTWNLANCPGLNATLKRVLEEKLSSDTGEWALTVHAVIATLLATNPQLQNLSKWTIPFIQPARRLVSLESIELSLSLLSRAATHPVLLLRWDVLYFSPFDLSSLNYSLFYRANWCAAVKAQRGAQSACVPLENFREFQTTGSWATLLACASCSSTLYATLLSSTTHPSDVHRSTASSPAAWRL
jgi:hypothetical protein